MLVFGSLLALISGMFNAAAAALEKREGMHTGLGRRGLRLLVALAQRPLWLLAIGLSIVAWVCEAASLATAPVPVVATLRNAGRGLLLAGGGRWLDERFSRVEVLAVVLASAGAAITAVGAAHTAVVRKPLSNAEELAVGGICVGAAAIIVRAASWLGASRRRGTAPGTPGPYRSKAAGAAMGTAVGVLFAGTGIFTKEIGDRFALYGLGGLAPAATSAGPWLMVVMAVWSQSLVQQAFRWANAATVSAANASVASLGLIAAGFALYGENIPGGVQAFLLVGGMAVALIGTALLIASRPG